MRSADIEKFKYNKTVYLAVIGKCSACYYCVIACQENAIKECTPPTVNHSLCTRCLKCIEACPRDVMQIIY